MDILEQNGAFKPRPEGHPSILPRCQPGAALLSSNTFPGDAYVAPMKNVIMIELSNMGPAISACGCLIGYVISDAGAM